MEEAPILWTPSAARREGASMAAFIRAVNKRFGLSLPLAYAPLWKWSVAAPERFWDAVWDFTGVIGDKGGRIMAATVELPGARFFPDGSLNFAENLLRNADDRPALVAWDESGERQSAHTRAELRAETLHLAAWLRAQGVGVGDRVCAYMPNAPETVIAMLAAATLGAVFSSCSMDFGADGVVARFGQIAPKALIAADGYQYGGKRFDRRAAVADIAARLPSLRAVVIKTPDAPPPGAVRWQDAIAGEGAPPEFVRVPFNAPLAILYSSGTTGAPKCIVHGGGGILLQHAKEHALHADIRAGDKVFYFTTCGWMMWNWLVSALAREAAIVLWEGSPAAPSAMALWDMAAAENVALFGASAKYLDALRKAKTKPAAKHSLPALRTICSTGSPLLPDGFRYVYENVKTDVHLAPISGGTDIVSCFLLGNPFDPVRAGDMQGRGLGMNVAVYDETGAPVVGEAGELVCLSPAPSMPLGFWGDEDGGQYRAAYFEKFPGVWAHGDWATQREDGGYVIHGRSDATLNPGGVRVGAAEIYRHVEAFDEIAEALAVGQKWDGDERVILFVRLAEGATLDDALCRRLRDAIRKGASPRCAPAKILAAPDIPRTRSGKISELAVRDIIHGREVKNQTALANPEALAHFANRPELRD